jgi:hypothetical protein
MNMSEKTQTDPTFGLEGNSARWMSACMQPWSVLQDWNAFWLSQWKTWFEAIASAPNPWVSALASGRADQAPAIDFFLPWLPRMDAVVTSFGPAGANDAMRVMLRAASPRIGPREAAGRANGAATRSSIPPLVVADEATPVTAGVIEALPQPPEESIQPPSEKATKPSAPPKRRVRKTAIASAKPKPGKAPAGT